MTPELIRLRKGHWQSMLENVLSCLPEEACGLLGGEEGKVFSVRPVKNISRSPTRFRMDPGEQVKAMFEIEEMGHQIVAIYHTHPMGPEVPSEIDVNELAYPEAVHLIWYPSGGEWNCRAFLMLPEGPEEIPIVLDG
jgi:proteasome lid subunit RPN8/RPN11